jgi:large subunit ribosomal protein L4
MTLDVVNSENAKVGVVDVRDEVFGGRVNAHVIWESVVHANAAGRRGTHATKNRANVSGSGRKPWRQKGTGRARVGEIRNPLWRKGGTVFGPQPRSYDYKLPKKVELGALRAALAQKLKDGHVLVVDALALSEVKTQLAAAMLKTLGVSGKAVMIDVLPDEKLARSIRNIPGVRLLASARVTARDVMNAGRVVTTGSALEMLQDVLAQSMRTAPSPKGREGTGAGAPAQSEQ